MKIQNRPLPVFLATTFLLTYCSTEDVAVEHLDYDPSSQRYVLTSSTVSTFKDSNASQPVGAHVYIPRVQEMEGVHTLIRAGGAFGCNKITGIGDRNHMTRSSVREKCTVRPSQKVDLQYSTSLDGTIQPADYDGLAMLTVYVHLDRLHAFARDVLEDNTAANTSRLIIYYGGQTGAGFGLPFIGGPSIPFTVTDNAAYDFVADGVILYRTIAPPAQIDFAIHPGVLAHEYGHRILHHNVMHSPSSFRSYVLMQMGTEEEKSNICAESVVDGFALCAGGMQLLRGMDEGTADIIAALFTGDWSSWLEQLGIAGRDMAGEPPAEDEAHFDAWAARVIADKQGPYLYWLGVLWSRGFFHSVVDPDTGHAPADDAQRLEIARRIHGPAMVRAWYGVGDELEARYQFSPYQFLRRFIMEVSGTTGNVNEHLQHGACTALCERFGKEAFPPSVGELGPQCAGVMTSNPRVDEGRAFVCQL